MSSTSPPGTVAGRPPGPLTPVVLADLPGRPCPIAASLEVVGERWALLVVREIWMGSTRFTDIVLGTGAPRDRVAARLKVLEQAGVIAREQYQSSPPRFDYVLTDAGRGLIPVLRALLSWGREYAVASNDPDLERHRRPRIPRPAGAQTPQTRSEEHP